MYVCMYVLYVCMYDVGWMDGCMDGWIDGCMDGWIDGWMVIDGWVDVMDGCI